jgi:phosphoribosylformylglycinamidine synthase subunit PurSL
MTARVEVGFKPEVRDAHGCKVLTRLREELKLDVRDVTTIDVYIVDMALSPEEIQLLATGPYCDAVTQMFSVSTPLATNFDWIAEVGYKPGVTDNAGRTALEAASLCLGRSPLPGEKVYTSRQYLFRGELSRQEVERIVTQILANDLIQRHIIASHEEFEREGGLNLPVPRVSGSEKAVVEEIDIQLSDEALLQLSRERLLALSLDEMRTIKDHFNLANVLAVRSQFGLQHAPTDAEIEALGQTWSEHCKHKIFNACIDYTNENGIQETIHSLFATCIKGSTQAIRDRLGNRDWCVSVFKDNAGVITWNDSYNLVYKVETHNSPSALDPYGGALTGIVGVNRDTIGTGMAAKLIFNTDVFCFASPFHEKELPPRILHPRRILEGVREGVEHGGNKSGIPTVNGSIIFDERFLGKPLVYCGTGGIMPRQILGEPSEVKNVYPGDLIVMAGGRIGKDGIHGATFSSEELHEGSPVTAVQIGDPITQKRMCDFILEARDQGMYRCITDNGAGGLSSSVGEMAQFSGGCDLDLKKAPLKYSGLQPWEILVSESQERMTFAVAPQKVDAFLNLAAVMNVEAVVLGSFTDTGLFLIRYGDRTVACLDMAFLHEGLPPMHLKAAWNPPQHSEPSFAEPVDLTEALIRLLARLNICSKEMIVRQYDHEVQGGSVIKPLTGLLNDGPSDAAVLRPVLESMRGVVVSHGICPRYSDIDTYHMTACAIDEALRNFLCVGGSLDGIAGLDNFCWCDPIASDKNPDGNYKLAQLVRANRALYDYSIAYTIPCISGKDSMKNDYVIGDLRIAIPPTLLFSVIGSIDDVRRAVTMDVKQPGDLVYVLGITKNELGASEYFAMQGAIGNSVPHVDAPEALKLYQALSRAIGQGLIRSCHDCSDGGLGISLVESSFAGGLGMDIDLRMVPRLGIERSDYLLFSESQSRFVITIDPDKRDAFEMSMNNLTYARIGTVGRDGTFKVTGLQGSTIINADISVLKRSWQKTLDWM